MTFDINLIKEAYKQIVNRIEIFRNIPSKPLILVKKTLDTLLWKVNVNKILFVEKINTKPYYTL